MCRNYTDSELKIIERVKKERTSCCFCGRELLKKERTIEHLLPINRCGQTEYENLEVACLKCNKNKSDMTLKEYQMLLDRKQTMFQFFDETIKLIKNNIEDNILEITRLENEINKNIKEKFKKNFKEIMRQLVDKRILLKKLNAGYASECKIIENQKKILNN